MELWSAETKNGEVTPDESPEAFLNRPVAVQGTVHCVTD